MLGFSGSGDCERAGALVSLALDGELSEVEDAQLAAHLRACAACERRACELRALTDALRTAPLETPARRFVAPARRSARRFVTRAALAATLAACAAGLGVLAGSLGREPAPTAPPAPEVALVDERREDLQVRDRRRANQRTTAEREAPRARGV